MKLACHEYMAIAVRALTEQYRGGPSVSQNTLAGRKLQHTSCHNEPVLLHYTRFAPHQ
jgi:hypothetical protein